MRASLYYGDVVDTVGALATNKPNQLLMLIGEFLQTAVFEGFACLPNVVSSTIENA